MESLTVFNTVIGLIFLVCYAYQFVYIAVALVKKPKAMPEAAPNRYAVLISARNEEGVIGALLQSLAAQDYPQEYIDVYVVADNCTDATAAVARAAGANVLERRDLSRVGKGYALDFLLRYIDAQVGLTHYAGYFVFDADNLLDEHFIAEMNKTFSQSHRIVTSYRNSKNYGDNWISAGYSLWFLRDSRYLNGARMLLNTSGVVAGTGFLVSSDVLSRCGGWPYHLLTEDTEFTVDSILHGERVAYCASALLYDEQPVTFRQSWRQRMRWAKGYLQVFRGYGGRLLGRLFQKRDFAAYDMIMSIMPAIVLSVFSAVVNGAAMLYSVLVLDQQVGPILLSVGESLLGAYLLLFIVGAITTATEWKHIHCPGVKKVAYAFTFPLFMFTYIPISLAALLCKVEWKPIHHGVCKTLQDVRGL